MATEEEVQKLRMEVEGAERLKDLTEGLKDQEKAFDKAETASRKAAGSTRNFGRAGLEAGRMLQDFAQGGIGGVLNNLEGLAMSLGGPAGLAGLITGVGVAAYVALPQVRDFFDGVMNGVNEIPKSADALERFNEALATNKTRLDELKGKQSLNNFELSEYNRLLADTAKLEKQAAEERAKRQAAEAARNQKTPTENSIGAAFSSISGGANFDKMAASVAGLTDYQKARVEFARLEEKGRKGEATPDDVKRKAELAKWINANAPGLGGGGSPEDVKAMMGRVSEAEDLIGRARGGDEKAFDAILGKATGDLKDQLNAIDPRQAGKRAANEDLARKQVGNLIYQAISPLASGLRGDREDQRAAAANTKAIDDQMTGAYKDKLTRDKQAEREQLAAQREADREAAQKQREAQRAANEAAKQAEAQRKQWEADHVLNRPQPTDAAEAQMLEAQRAMIAVEAQADMMNGQDTPLVQQLQELTARINQLYQRNEATAAQQRQMRMQNSRMMGGQMGGGGFSQLPMYTGGM